jgi:hypothetical protein
VAPLASQWAPLDEYRGPDPGTILQTEVLYVGDKRNSHAASRLSWIGRPEASFLFRRALMARQFMNLASR